MSLTNAKLKGFRDKLAEETEAYQKDVAKKLASEKKPSKPSKKSKVAKK